MILLTGATGFTGRFVVDELLRRGLRFRCLVRSRQKVARLVDRGVEVCEGDVRQGASYPTALVRCSGIINLVSFGEEHVPLLIEQARIHGIRRALFVGTTAIFTRLNAGSKALRHRIEDAIRSSGLDWTLLRPTMIYGAKGDRNMERMIRAIHRFRIHPLIGQGDKLIQPIFVGDLAKAIVDAYQCDGAVGRAFNVSGREPLSYRSAVRIVSELLGKTTHTVSLPVPLALVVARIARRLPGLPSIKHEQILRLDEDKAFAYTEAKETWGFDPIDFREGVRREMRDLGLPVREPRPVA